MIRSLGMTTFRLGFLLAALLALALAVGVSGASAKERSAEVFTLSNSPAGNQVLVFDRESDGTLTQVGAVDTGGLGTGGGIGSQGALALAGRRLLAVNPASDSISLFAVKKDGISLLDVESSGGDRPISVTVSGNSVYVLNAGAPENITGLRIVGDSLNQLPGSSRALSGAGVGPAQVQFSPDGHLLVVTEKGTNNIDTYVVGPLGYAVGPWVQPSAGQTPFGFAFARRDKLIVSEAFGGAAGASAVSSYDVGFLGALATVTPSSPTTETAACWIAISKNGKFAYTTNTGSSSVTGYEIARDGSLTVLDADGVTGSTPTGSGPIDASVSGSGRFLDVLSVGTATITTFEIGPHGDLTDLGSVAGLPASAVGLVSR